jgi:uncharacterized membrane protein
VQRALARETLGSGIVGIRYANVSREGMDGPSHGPGGRAQMIIRAQPQDRAPSREGADLRPFGRVLARNISTLVEIRQQEEHKRGLQDRIADAITDFTGSMTFVYIHVLLCGAWIVVNLGWTSLPRFDPTFVGLAMIASVEAIFLSTFVLISQKRMQIQDQKRAELDLQISLLAEHEITQVVALLDTIAQRLGVERVAESDLEESKQDVDPAGVYEAIERHEEQAKKSPSG